MGIPWDGMGWVGIICCGMGWDGTEKHVPWTSLPFQHQDGIKKKPREKESLKKQ